MPIILETARLVMREWRTEDFDPFHAMNRDPYVRQFYADHNSVQQSRDFLARAKERDLRDGYFFSTHHRKGVQLLYRVRRLEQNRL